MRSQELIRAEASQSRTGRPADDPVLPRRSSDDSPEGWHEADDSNDERLRRDVPPHWA